jgi:hypothetical protein
MDGVSNASPLSAMPASQNPCQICPFTERFLKKFGFGRTISCHRVLRAGEPKMTIMRSRQIYTVYQMVQSMNDYEGKGFFWDSIRSASA